MALGIDPGPAMHRPFNCGSIPNKFCCLAIWLSVQIGVISRFQDESVMSNLTQHKLIWRVSLSLTMKHNLGEIY